MIENEVIDIINNLSKIERIKACILHKGLVFLGFSVFLTGINLMMLSKVIIMQKYILKKQG
jgi:hypothetical protein